MANEIKDKFDVIVVGSGVSGLGAASSLRKLGKSVVIFEAKGNLNSFHLSTLLTFNRFSILKTMQVVEYEQSMSAASSVT